MAEFREQTTVFRVGEGADRAEVSAGSEGAAGSGDGNSVDLAGLSALDLFFCGTAEVQEASRSQGCWMPFLLRNHRHDRDGVPANLVILNLNLGHDLVRGSRTQVIEAGETVLCTRCGAVV